MTKRTRAPAFSGTVPPLLRRMYEGDVARLAHELRGGFVSGKFRGWREKDGKTPWLVSPLSRLEREIGRRYIGTSLGTAYLILAISPSEPESWDEGTTDPRYHAAEAMAYDVLRYARAAGWVKGRDAEPAAKPAKNIRRTQGDDAFSRWGWRDEKRTA